MSSVKSTIHVPEKKELNQLKEERNPTFQLIQEQRKRLPIWTFREDILKTIEKNQVLIIVGETGSGKSTQLSQFLAEEYQEKKGIIGITQPRRVGAVSLARRVSEELGCDLGDKVGYAVRFSDKTSSHTKIKYMTDGTLLRECLLDPLLRDYSVIILDEAHERSVHTDILFGLMKVTIEKRPDLKILITSATLDDEKFSKFFGNCPTFFVPGRSFPVEVFYYENKKNENDFTDAALDCVLHIHQNEPEGDILLFLTGQQEIESACNLLQKRMDKIFHQLEQEQSDKDYMDLLILPLYAALPPQEQIRVFEPTPKNTRKVVIATNIAETSLTVDGIVYVIDPGYVKQKLFNPTTGMESLNVVLISKVAAQQRAGRAGRTKPGKCFRMYTSKIFEQMDDVTLPEIQRSNLSNVVLSLKALEIYDVIGFPFLDQPDPFLLLQAVKHLHQLDALDDYGQLTEIGKLMSAFPLEPSYSRMLIGSVNLKCSEEMLTLISMMSLENIFYRPSNKKLQIQFEEKRQKLFQKADSSSSSEFAGDHNLLLYIYHTWKKNSSSSQWCRDHFIQSRSLEEADNIRRQLTEIMIQQRLEILSSARDSGIKFDRITCAMCTGLYMNFAKKTSRPLKKGDSDFTYWLVKPEKLASLHPMSLLVHSAKEPPLWVIFSEYISTTRPFIKMVCGVKYEWIEPLLFKRKAVDVNKLIGRNVTDLISSSIVTEEVFEEKIENTFLEKTFARKNTNFAVDAAKMRFLARRKASEDVNMLTGKKKKTT